MYSFPSSSVMVTLSLPSPSTFSTLPPRGTTIFAPPPSLLTNTVFTLMLTVTLMLLTTLICVTFPSPHTSTGALAVISGTMIAGSATSMFTFPSSATIFFSTLTPASSLMCRGLMELLVMGTFFFTVIFCTLHCRRMTVFSPPPRTRVSPSTVTPSRMASPSPTPSPIMRSPVTVTSFSVTPSTLMITFPSGISVTTPGSRM